VHPAITEFLLEKGEVKHTVTGVVNHMGREMRATEKGRGSFRKLKIGDAGAYKDIKANGKCGKAWRERRTKKGERSIRL